jgi:hypothetical protein
MQHELGWDVVNCYDEWNGGVELKKPGVNVREGFDKNLCDYEQTIPQFFHYLNRNAACCSHVLEEYPESGESVYEAAG